jgi:thiamine biosynthesis lipoprotein
MSASRRTFLLAAGAAGLLSWPLFRAGLQPPKLFTRTSWALGSDVSLTVAAANEASASRALAAAFDEIERVEQVLSLYRSDSQVSQLNRERSLRDPHPFLLTVLHAAREASTATAGAFDITIQPLWSAYALAQHEGRSPTAEQLAHARSKVGWRQVKFDRARVELREPVESISLNGIAQGFALDRAVDILKQHGIQNALVNTGEIGGLGTKDATDRWSAGIQHPRERDAYVAVANLDGRALATSGDYETRFSQDFARNHIFDPRTGESPTELASVSVVAPTGMQADVLSTAAMVLGRQKTLQLLATLPQVDALLVDKAGRVTQTPGFPSVDLG